MEITETLQPTEPKSFSWPKIILAAVLGLGLLAGSAYAGYWYAIQQVITSNQEPPAAVLEELEATPTSKPAPFTPVAVRELFQDTRVADAKYAFVRDDNIWTHNGGVTTQIAENTTKGWAPSPKTSPDGQKIALLRNTTINTHLLYVVGFDGGGLKQLADDVSWGDGKIWWSSDSKEIFYTAVTSQHASEQGKRFKKIASVDVASGQKKERGLFLSGNGCGGGSYDPSDHLYDAEVDGHMATDVDPFQLSPDGNFILHSINCHRTGVGLFSLLTKEDKLISEGLIRATFSPSGDRIAGVLDDQVVILNLSGEKLATLEVSDVPATLFWPGENRIYFTTRNLVGYLDVDQALAKSIDSPLSYGIFKSEIWSIKTDGVEEKRVCEVDSHGLRILHVSGDGQRIIFSDVENAKELYNYVHRYRTKEDITEYYPKVNILVWKATSDGIFAAVPDAAQSSVFVPE